MKFNFLMFRLSILFLLSIFILWLLPLGYFIKPSQENMVCGGQRALCMCSSQQILVNAKDKAKAGKVYIALNPAVEKEGVSSGFGFFYFKIFLKLQDQQNVLVQYLESTQQLQLLLIAKAIDHVPKA